MYSKGRICTSEDNERFEHALSTISELFGKNWLESDSDHELKIVWKRSDPLASTELLIFGDCLSRCRDIDEKKTKKLVKKIKEENRNNRRGAIYEVLVIGAFKNKGHYNVKFPVKPNNPGYDLLLDHSDKYTIYMSVKNFGAFQRVDEVNEKAKEIEDIIKCNIHPGFYNVIIYFSTFPDIVDWGILKEKLPSILDSKAQKTSILNGGCNIYKIFKDRNEVNSIDLPGIDGLLSPEATSYIFELYTKLFEYDEQNLREKLDDACFNLAKHRKSESRNNLNIVFLRIPKEIPIETCDLWVEKYLEKDKASNISGIILYQPMVISLDKDTNGLAHCYKIKLNPNIEQMIDLEEFRLDLEFAVGVPCSSTPPFMIITDIGNLIINDTEYYKRQFGHLYLSQSNNQIYIKMVGDIVVESTNTDAVLRQLGMNINNLLPATNDLFLL